MPTKPDPLQNRKRGRLLGVFSGLRKRSKSPGHSTQDSSIPLQALVDEPPALLEGGPLQEAGRQHSLSRSPDPSPTIHVEDRSIHHYGDICERELTISYRRGILNPGTDHGSHSGHGTANYIGSVANATLGTHSGEHKKRTLDVMTSPFTRL